MPTALPLTTHVSQRSTRKRTYRALSSQFGDGYSQEAPDGTNATVDEWSVQFDNLTDAERATLYAALDAVGSWDYLTWTPPGESEKKWKITSDGVSETPVSGEHYTVSFSLRQVF